jgi:hypothetical protein
MRNRITGIALALAALTLTDLAQAEVTRLGLRFAGGCHSGNVDGSCTLDTIAFGEDFESSPGVQLFSAPTHNGEFRKVSNFKRKLDQDGRARSRFKNISGACYQMRIAKTEFQPAVSSDILCEAAEGEPSKVYPVKKQAGGRSEGKKKAS